MKKLTASLAALALVLVGNGCMSNGIAKMVKELAQDTNSIHLKVNGWGVSIELQRNAGGISAVVGEAGTGAVTLTPMTTFKVQPTK